jgi:transposase-like protein
MLMKKHTNCPRCNFDRTIKNSNFHNGKQKSNCKNCGRQFVENPTNKVISQKEWDFVDNLFMENLSASGISGVTGISETWLKKYINEKYEENIKQRINIVKKGHLSI